ncbi:hypothetical protein DPMN_034416 [Dreissena polymorpha]|uniref:Uncharacterized protein n=1 Tax=Dreissena polymorpha TaxID=45954 RepID=A0A9D4M5H3_DREPO|nr:hypothetical protein DPMN_034416 [Dreissena polymorpha]
MLRQPLGLWRTQRGPSWGAGQWTPSSWLFLNLLGASHISGRTSTPQEPHTYQVGPQPLGSLTHLR